MGGRIPGISTVTIMKNRIIPKFDTKRVMPDGWRTYLYASKNWWADLKFNLGSWWFWWAKGWPFRRRCFECAGSGRRSKHNDEWDCDRCEGTGLVERKR